MSNGQFRLGLIGKVSWKVIFREERSVCRGQRSEVSFQWAVFSLQCAEVRCQCSVFSFQWVVGSSQLAMSNDQLNLGELGSYRGK